jgi:hypothetical protein
LEVVMAAEMPAPVEPVDGATPVEFPWEAATDAVDALNAAASELGHQLGARPRMWETLNDWSGTYRGDFERADGRLIRTATGLRAELVQLASSIVSQAEEANQFQRTNNTIADNERRGLIPPLGGRA